MMLQCFAVLDKAIGAFLPPFFARSKGEAIRSFSDAANDAQHQFARHADDYLLCNLGTFDDSSGLFESVEPVRVVSARECITSEGDVGVDPVGVEELRRAVKRSN